MDRRCNDYKGDTRNRLAGKSALGEVASVASERGETQALLELVTLVTGSMECLYSQQHMEALANEVY
jgi:hypothetical protein